VGGMLFVLQAIQKRSKRRNERGQAIAETGPAIFILFIVILFPLIDMLYMGFAYAVVWYMNYLEVRELAVRVPAETTQAISDVDSYYLTTSFGKFVGLSPNSIQHQTARSGDPTIVSCTTTAQVRPFLTLPFLIPVAGINQSVTFSVTSTRLQEELGLD